MEFITVALGTQYGVDSVSAVLAVLIKPFLTATVGNLAVDDRKLAVISEIGTTRQQSKQGPVERQNDF